MYSIYIYWVVYVCPQLYRTSELSEEKVRILRVLGQTPNSEKLKSALQFSISVSCLSYEEDIQCYIAAHWLLYYLQHVF